MLWIFFPRLLVKVKCSGSSQSMRCAAAGMRVLITLPWAKHVEFLRKKSSRDQISGMVREAVATHRGHPAIFGYLVGNALERRKNAFHHGEDIQGMVGQLHDRIDELFHQVGGYVPVIELELLPLQTQHP